MKFACPLLVFVLCSGAGAAAAQTLSTPAPASDNPLSRLLQNTQERIECPTFTHCILTGTVDIDLGNGTRFNADVIELLVETAPPDSAPGSQTRVIARGNVVFSNAQARIAAEEVEFNVEAGTGIFRTAQGSMTIAGANPAEFGNQDPDITFTGETIEKIGPRSYRMTKGVFTTCVQPTPRWEIISDSITINMDDYAIARNMVLRVKGVPLMYLPLIYYPIQDDQRATGFLLPTYGTSTTRGQAISNAFFWVLGRSQDMTLFHDWFTQAGQGMGAEYRYAAAAGSFGNFRFYRFAQSEAAVTREGTTTVRPEVNSYQIAAAGTHMFGQNIRLTQRVDYASNIEVRQRYQQNVYEASNATRSVDVGLSGVFGRLSTSALFQRAETFTGTNTSQLYGSTPRLSASLAPTPLSTRTPVYVSLNTDYAWLPNRTMTGDTVTRDLSVGRFDLQPRLQAALSRLTYLSVNTTASYRLTQYNRNAASGEPILRRFMAFRTEAVGPVFSKIWDTVDSTFSERMKHVIEPTFAVDHVSEIANASLIPVVIDPSDRIVGGSMRFIYGLTNRFFYRARTADNSAGTTVEYLTLRVQQTFYRNPAASLTDTDYVSSGLRARAVDLSNIALQARVAPSASGAIDGTARLEYDVHGRRGLQVATAGLNVRQGLSTSSINFSRTVQETTAITQPVTVTSSMSGSTSLSFLQRRLTSGYSLTWDISRSAILSQSVATTYLAQCCGIQAEFQKFKYPLSIAGAPASDRRFNVAVVLAGLGTFSNFFGAFDSLVGVRR